MGEILHRVSGKDRKKYYGNLNYFLDFIFPQRCVFCDSFVEDFSEFGAVCFSCRNLLREEVSPSVLEDVGDINLLGYVGIYDRMLKICLNRFKYFGFLNLYKFLGKLLVEVILENFSNFDIITFVPMYKKKYLKRGFNQSQLLASYISKFFNVEVEKLLIKRKDTPPQSSMNFYGRKRNVKNVFKVDCNDLDGRSILIVDDVFTTGNTLKECAKELVLKGADKVFGVVVAIDYFL